MILDAQEQILADLLERDYVIFAMKDTTVLSKKTLARQYPELDDYPEIKELSEPEKLFVWLFAARCSPIIDMPEEKRVIIAIDKAFKVKAVADARKIEYGTLAFPDAIKAAIRIMDRFDPAGRIERAINDAHMLKMCNAAIRQDISAGTPEEMAAYMKTAALARDLQGQILKDIERGNHGVVDKKDTQFSGTEGVSGRFMKSKL